MNLLLPSTFINNSFGKYFIFIVFCCLPFFAFATEDQPVAKNGILDLRLWDFQKNPTLKLNGEYTFFWQQLITPEQLDPSIITNTSRISEKTESTIHVPGNWSEYSNPIMIGFGQRVRGYGTYYLRILLPDSAPEQLMLRISPLSPSYKVFINNRLVQSAGEPGESANTTKTGTVSSLSTLINKHSEIELVIQVANFHALLGGIMHAPILGISEYVTQEQQLPLFFFSAAIGSIFLFAIYHIGLFVLRRNEFSSLLFGLFAIAISVRMYIHLDAHFLLGLFTYFGATTFVKFDLLTHYTLIFLIATFLTVYYIKDISRVTKAVSLTITTASILLIIHDALAQPENTGSILIYYNLIVVFTIIYGVFFMSNLALKGVPDSLLRLISVVIIAILALPGIYQLKGIVFNFDYSLYFGWIAFVFVQGILIASSFSRAFNTIDVQHQELSLTNKKYELEFKQRKKAERKRQKLEKELEKARKLESLGQITGAVAHDLNNILGRIVNYPELLLMNKVGGKAAQEPLCEIRDSGIQIAAIVQDLLTMTRRNVAQHEVINLNDIIQNYTDTLEYKELKNKYPGTFIDITLNPNLPNTKISKIHVQKTLMNLVHNAAEAIKDKGNLRISTKSVELSETLEAYETIEPGEYIVLTVEDTGSGISEEDLPNLFEPFYTRKKMGKSGTGLGLAIVSETMKDVSGFIDIKTRVNKGTSFELYFPVSYEIPIKQSKGKPVNYQGYMETILIVDDVAAQREMASEILVKLNYKPVAVESGEMAIEYIRHNNVDLVMLDMILGGIDGLDTYITLKQIDPHLRSIIASGYAETDRVRKAQKLGGGIFVQKPYTIETLGLAIYHELHDSPKRTNRNIE